MSNDPNANDANPGDERTRSGQPLYRHRERTMPFQPTHGDGDVIDAISAHIERHVGPVANVFHEIVSDLVHIDVHVVAPTDERPFYTLVTSGMSEAPMTTPPEFADYRFAELAICLPPTWPLGMDATEPSKGPLNDERNYWPIRLLKSTARMPHEYDTWLCEGHTLSNGDPAEPYAPGVAMNGVILLPPVTLGDGFHTLQGDGRTTHFWSLYPLHPDEMQLKLDRGLDALIPGFQRDNVSDILNPTRPSSVRRKKWLGLF